MFKLPSHSKLAANSLPWLTLLATLHSNPATALTANSSAQLETMVVTAGREQQLLSDAAVSISVISAKDLQLINHTHISESLSRVPGVWVSRGNGQEHLTAIRSPVLTGAGSCAAFTVAEDGIAVRPTGFCNVNQLFDINTEQAQRIEVLRGPGTSIHGSDALHGVINVISPAISKTAQQQLSLAAGSNDYNRLKYSQSQTFGQQGYRLSVNGTHDGGYKNASGFDQQKLSFKHNYSGEKLTATTLLTASNLNQETAGFVVGENAYKDDSLKRQNPNPEAFRDSQTFRLQSKLEQSLNNDGRLIVSPYIRYSDMAFMMHFLPGTPLEENGQRSAGLQTLYVRPINQQLQLSQGVDIEITDAYLKQSQQGGFSSFPTGKQYDYQVDAQLIAAFLNADYQPRASTSLSAGARYEQLEYQYDNRMLSGDTAADGSLCVNGFTGAIGCRYSRPEDRRDSFNNWSFNTSIKQQLSDQLDGLIRVSHGFRAPQATELYRLQNGQTEAQLDSEAISSIELALSGSSAALSYQLTSFYMKKSNVIFQSSDRLNLDNGETEHYGLEYQLGWQISQAWKLAVNGTFARHYYTNDVRLFGASDNIKLKGNDIDTAPRRMSTAQLSWTPTDNTEAELEWVAMGKHYTDIDNAHSYQGHNLLHLRLRQRLNSDISVGLRISNLTDADYAERADYSSFDGDRYFIGEPRSYHADISFSF
jgi:outer membrane receptor protein involved in Fe transport